MNGRQTPHTFTNEFVFRHCAPTHTDLIHTLHASRRIGGRFNPAGTFGTIYAAANRDTVQRELDRAALRLGRPRSDLMPRTLLILHLRVQHLLDLTIPALQTAWGLSPKQLAQDDWSPCQDIGRAAYLAGYEAIRFPTADGTGTNYAIYLDHLMPGSHLHETHREDLDP